MLRIEYTIYFLLNELIGGGNPMPFGKINMFRNLQVMPQQNQVFRPQAAPGQFGGGGNYTGMPGQGLQRFLPLVGGQGGLPMPPGLNRLMNGQPQGYAQQQPQQPQLQQPIPSAQGYPSQGYPQQGYAPQWNNQGYGVQTPVQPAWEEPKKGGIKGFISNLMAKFK